MKSELERGIIIEREHTDDPAVAEKIARDHLAEDPRYYTRLAAMEAGACDFLGAFDEIDAQLKKVRAAAKRAEAAGQQAKADKLWKQALSLAFLRKEAHSQVKRRSPEAGSGLRLDYRGRLKRNPPYEVRGRGGTWHEEAGWGPRAQLFDRLRDVPHELPMGYDRRGPRVVRPEGYGTFSNIHGEPAAEVVDLGVREARRYGGDDPEENPKRSKYVQEFGHRVRVDDPRRRSYMQWYTHDTRPIIYEELTPAESQRARDYLYSMSDAQIRKLGKWDMSKGPLTEDEKLALRYANIGIKKRGWGEAEREHVFGTPRIGKPFFGNPEENPSADLPLTRGGPRKGLEEAFIQFHGVEPDSETVMDRVWVPGPLIRLGTCIDIGYLPLGGSSKGRKNYVHDHGVGVKVYVRPDACEHDAQPDIHYRNFPKDLWVLGANIGFTYDDRFDGQAYEVKGSSRYTLAAPKSCDMLVVVDGEGVLFVVKGGNLRVEDWIYE